MATEDRITGLLATLMDEARREGALSALWDVDERMARAVATLSEMVEALRVDDEDVPRLKGKADGLRVARSYVTEALRVLAGSS